MREPVSSEVKTMSKFKFPLKGKKDYFITNKTTLDWTDVPGSWNVIFVNTSTNLLFSFQIF